MCNCAVNWCDKLCFLHLYSVITNQTLHDFFVNTSKILVINVSCRLDISTECSKCPPDAATHARSLFQNDWIALSMNSCVKLFHTDSKAVFSWAMLVGFGVCSIPVSHLYVIIQWIEIWRLKHRRGFLRQNRRFNYLFTLKNVHLSSNSYNFWLQSNIAMRSAEYVDWILVCKRWNFCEINHHNSRHIEFFIEVTFLARPVHDGWVQPLTTHWSTSTLSVAMETHSRLSSSWPGCREHSIPNVFV